MRSLIVILVVASGCYDPSGRSCTVQCASSTDCIDGFSCGADGWCASGDMLDRCADVALPDAPNVDDAAPQTSVDAGTDSTQPPPPMDAPPACAADCAGTCEMGVCVIRCSGPNECQQQVRCPATGACRVECMGNKGCSGRVVCGAGRCDVECLGKDSCDSGVDCSGSCACNVTCTGEASCDVPASCPSASCDTGNGCTANGACNDC